MPVTNPNWTPYAMQVDRRTLELLRLEAKAQDRSIQSLLRIALDTYCKMRKLETKFATK